MNEQIYEFAKTIKNIKDIGFSYKEEITRFIFV